jgi:ABC-2 type transport system permease protein
MFSLVQVELYKIFKRPRTYIAFGAVAALIGIIQFGLKLDGKSYLDFMLNDLSSSLEIDGKILNGYLVC